MHQIVNDIQSLVFDYSRLLRKIHKSSSKKKSNSNILCVLLGDNDLLLPATFHSFSQRTRHLQIRLESLSRKLAQSRRHSIINGLKNDMKSLTIDEREKSKRKTIEIRNELEKISINQTNKQMIQRLGLIIDACDLFNEIIQVDDVSDKTFRLLPVIGQIHRQVNHLFDRVG